MAAYPRDKEREFPALLSLYPLSGEKVSWPLWTVSYQLWVKASEDVCCQHSEMGQNFVSTLVQLKKPTLQLPSYGHTQLSFLSLQKQDSVGQLMPTWFLGTWKEQICFRLMLTMVLQLPPSLTTFPKGLHLVHEILLILWCQRHNIGMSFHHGACGALFAICIYLPISSQSVLQLFNSSHCRLWHLISNILPRFPH